MFRQINLEKNTWTLMDESGLARWAACDDKSPWLFEGSFRYNAPHCSP